MKWLAFISRELPNSANYFSSFADVSADNIQVMGATCGRASYYFKPWNYNNRVKVAQKVEAFKRKLLSQSNYQLGPRLPSSFLVRNPGKNLSPS